jgi:hypothetical protein
MEISMRHDLFTAAPRIRTMRRAWIAALAAIAVTATSVHPAGAEPPFDPSRLKTAPAESSAISAPAAVLSETPLQMNVRLKCNSNSTSCLGRFPAVPAKERWAIQFASCIATSMMGAMLRNISVQITDAKVTRLLATHYLAPGFQSHKEPYHYTVSQPVVLSANASHYVYIFATSIGGIVDTHCAISGVRQKFA